MSGDEKECEGGGLWMEGMVGIVDVEHVYKE